MNFNYQITFRVSTLEDGVEESCFLSFAGKTSKDLSLVVDDCLACVSAMPMQSDYELLTVNYSPTKNPFDDEKEDK